MSSVKEYGGGDGQWWVVSRSLMVKANRITLEPCDNTEPNLSEKTTQDKLQVHKAIETLPQSAASNATMISPSLETMVMYKENSNNDEMSGCGTMLAISNETIQAASVETVVSPPYTPDFDLLLVMTPGVQTIDVQIEPTKPINTVGGIETAASSNLCTVVALEEYDTVYVGEAPFDLLLVVVRDVGDKAIHTPFDTCAVAYDGPPNSNVAATTEVALKPIESHSQPQTAKEPIDSQVEKDTPTQHHQPSDGEVSSITGLMVGKHHGSKHAGREQSQASPTESRKQQKHSHHHHHHRGGKRDKHTPKSTSEALKTTNEASEMAFSGNTKSSKSTATPELVLTATQKKGHSDVTTAMPLSDESTAVSPLKYLESVAASATQTSNKASVDVSECATTQVSLVRSVTVAEAGSVSVADAASTDDEQTVAEKEGPNARSIEHIGKEQREEIAKGIDNVVAAVDRLLTQTTAQDHRGIRLRLDLAVRASADDVKLIALIDTTLDELIERRGDVMAAKRQCFDASVNEVERQLAETCAKGRPPPLQLSLQMSFTQTDEDRSGRDGGVRNVDDIPERVSDKLDV